MAADIFVGEGALPSAKGTEIWTDVIIVGGSLPLDTGGNVQFIYNSGTTALSKFQSCTIVTGSITTERTGQLTVVGSIMSRGQPVPQGIIGSPVTTDATNIALQVGQSGTNTGSLQWILFHEKFGTGSPRVLLSLQGNSSGEVGSGWVVCGSLSAGSFLVYSEEASQTFDWMAVGKRS